MSKVVFIIVFLLPLIVYGGSSSDILPIIVADDVARDYRLFLGDRRVEDVTHYGGPHSRRDVIELVLFYQAIKLGGYDGQFSIYEHKNLRRALRRLSQGLSAVWSAPLSSDFLEPGDPILYSDPVTREGEFEVGLYALASNNKAMAADSLRSLKSLCFVSSRFWKADWMTLQSLDLPCLHNATRWSLMLKMVTAGRADVTLAPLQNTVDMALQVDDTKLYPIPGVKLALKGDRYWCSSRKHPMGPKAHLYLQKGIRILRQHKMIEKAYTQSGVWHAKAKNWELLNRPYHVEIP